MALVENIFLLCGAIALFLYGLNLLSSGVSELSGNKVKALVKKYTKSPIGAVLTGGACTAIAQSSVATNMIVIAFVKSGALSFYSACAVIMGTNVGTTITAQLVSLSTVSDFKISALGSFIAFVGLIFTLFKVENLKRIGKVCLGFGFVFMGIELLSSSVEGFKNYAWFTNLFLVKNPLLLLLNGFIITAILQSSSVVTSVMIVLSTLGLLSFKSATFLILGANIGTCLPVIFASFSFGKESLKSAIFNIAFNIFGCLVFFIPLVFAGDIISSLPPFRGGIGRAIANFHTLFNLTVCVVLLPFLKYFCKLVEKITDLLFFEGNNGAKNAQKGSKTSKNGLKLVARVKNIYHKY